MAGHPETASTKAFLSIVFSAATLIGLLLLILGVSIGTPDGHWNERPVGTYAFFWSFMIVAEGILGGLFLCGCAQLLVPIDRNITINRPSVGLTLLGGGMVLAGAWRILVLSAVATGYSSFSDFPSYADRERSAKQKAIANDMARQKAQHESYRAEAARTGTEFVRYFSSGGVWSTEVLPQDDMPEVEAAPARGGNVGSPRSMPGGSTEPPVSKTIILIVGPADILSESSQLRFGIAEDGKDVPAPHDSFTKLNPNADSLVRDIYIELRAEAINQQTVVAAIVEVPHRNPEELQTGAQSRFGTGSAPPAAAAPLSEAINVSDFHLDLGTPVDLKKAQPLSGADFKKWSSRIVGR